MNFIETALEIAMDAHKGQMRKNSHMPYIIHPMRVADAIHLPIHLPDDTITATALLHDVLEDCQRERLVEFQSRINELSAEVGEMVAMLTRGYHDDKMEYLRSFAVKPIRVLIVKIFDRYDNVMDFNRTNSRYATTYAKKAMSLYDTFDSRKSEFIQFAGTGFWFRMDQMVAEMRKIASFPWVDKA